MCTSLLANQGQRFGFSQFIVNGWRLMAAGSSVFCLRREWAAWLRKQTAMSRLIGTCRARGWCDDRNWFPKCMHLSIARVWCLAGSGPRMNPCSVDDRLPGSIVWAGAVICAADGGHCYLARSSGRFACWSCRLLRLSCSQIWAFRRLFWSLRSCGRWQLAGSWTEAQTLCRRIFFRRLAKPCSQFWDYRFRKCLL